MKYDLIVFGGGTSGVAAAYTASKLGLKTLLTEKSDVLGGAITQGLVIPCMKLDTANVNSKFSSELISFAKSFGAQHTYIDGNNFWFNPELLKIVFDSMLETVNCTVLYSTYPYNAVYHDSFFVDLFHKLLSLHIETNYIIDATSEGKIFKLLNCDFQEKTNERQLPSLRFTVSDINIKKFAQWLLKTDPDRNVTTVEINSNQIYLSTAYTWDTDKKWALTPLFSDAVEKKILKYEDTAYFQVFSIPNMPSSLVFNCPRIFPEGDISDPFVYSKALSQGRASIFRLYNFCKKYFPGFENASISHISDYFGVRESNRIKGQYTLTEQDIIQNKDFDNVSFYSDYPIDIHSDDKNGDKLIFTNHTYKVPIEVLKSDKYPNLYAAGRIISADFKAQSAVRTQLNCFSMGEAAAKDIHERIKNINK